MKVCGLNLIIVVSANGVITTRPVTEVSARVPSLLVPALAGE